jgi:hypothetical protein
MNDKQLKQNPIRDKLLAIAVRIVRLYQHMVEKKREYPLSKQILRGGTSFRIRSINKQSIEEQWTTNKLFIAQYSLLIN